MLLEGRTSPDHVPALCTMSESGGMMSGGVKGCKLSPSWSVMRHVNGIRILTYTGYKTDLTYYFGKYVFAIFVYLGIH